MDDDNPAPTLRRHRSDDEPVALLPFLAAAILVLSIFWTVWDLRMAADLATEGLVEMGENQ